VSSTRPRILAGLLFLCVLAAVVEPRATHAHPDGSNKKVLAFNRWMLRHAFEPFARGYNFVMPKWGQRRVTAFFGNLDGPRDIINSALQAKVRRSGTHGGRFLVNSTLGVAGFFDVSFKWFGWEAPPETVDETLGTWGVPLGPYWVLPFLGDSSPRHLVGMVADGFMNPVTVIVPFFVSIGPTPTDAVVLAVSPFLLRSTNLLASQMPSPFASQAEWDAYHRGKFDFPEYEIGRDAFIADEADRVAE
jgi:phospholipid-binding lipoprotein MlaA